MSDLSELARPMSFSFVSSTFASNKKKHNDEVSS
jgi:hypothetical protein